MGMDGTRWTIVTKQPLDEYRQRAEHGRSRGRRPTTRGSPLVPVGSGAWCPPHERYRLGMVLGRRRKRNPSPNPRRLQKTPQRQLPIPLLLLLMHTGKSTWPDLVPAGPECLTGCFFRSREAGAPKPGCGDPEKKGGVPEFENPCLLICDVA